MPGFSKVYRNGAEVGILDVAAGMLYQADRIEGISVTPEQAGSAEFQIVSTDDRNYADKVSLTVMGIKARPSGFALPSLTPTMGYSIYLSLPKPLAVDRNYEISSATLASSRSSLRYNPVRQEVQSLHVNQIGFRPDDPGKIGRLSLWLGSGGKSPIKPRTFQVLDDASGKSVLDGRIESFFPADRPDSLTPGRSLTQADVFVLDLSCAEDGGQVSPVCAGDRQQPGVRDSPQRVGSRVHHGDALLL